MALSRLLVVFLSMLALPCSGCNRAWSGGASPEAGGAGAWPFAPTSMRIYHLTQFDRDAEGGLLILCHIEMLDAWGDVTKGTGDLVVQLFGPEESMQGSDLVQRLVWDIDLSDLDANGRMFDRVTRTYRVQLVDLPSWVEEYAGADRRDPGRSLTLRATLTLDDGQGRRVLRDDYRLGS